MKSQLIRFSLILILLEFMLNLSGFAQTFSYINFTISEEPIILEQTNVPWNGGWPDGKFCFLPETDGSGWSCYWGEGDTFRTKAATTHLEDHIANNNWQLAFGRDVNRIDGFNDGGSWIIGVNRLENGKLVAFFHAESWWPGDIIAYKSIGVTYSSDNGLTWDPGKRILAASYPKPQEAAFTGLGDGCVVWNAERKQYICYFQENGAGMCMAASSDIEGTAGTWKKWDGKDFTIEGCNQKTLIGGKGAMIKNLDIVLGSSPSVMWNEYLNCWVMTYTKWGGDIYLSHSKDGIEWSKPVLLLTEPIKPLYPNLVSNNGDVLGGMNLRLYYSRNQDEYGIRELAYRTISFMGLTTIDGTFTAAVPCGDGKVNLFFKVTNAMPFEVEVSESPEGIAGALTIPATVTDENGIEYAVTSIGEDAFRGRRLNSVVLPIGIRTLYENAFRESSLESITFPSTLTEVWHNAFQDCKQLKSIEFNRCPACFEYDCFLGCSNLKELYIPNTVQFRNRDNSWTWNAFGSCTSLKTVTFEAFEEGQNRWSTTSLFPDCNALETVVLPSLSVMQQGFFWNCKNLKDVTILEMEDNFDARYNSFSKMFSGLNAEDILFHVPAGTAETMLKAGYMNLSDKSGLPIVRTEFESEAARVATLADALNDGDKASLTRAIANARSAVNAAEDYATVYTQIEAIKTAAKTFLTTATVPANFDITAVIINPDFEQLERGWKLPVEWVNYPNVNKRGWNGAYYENGKVSIDKFIDTWEKIALQDGDISQTIKALPEGIYRLEADIIATNQNDANAEVTGVSLFAGSQKTAVATKNEKPQHFSVEFTLDETGDCTIGINVNNTNANWVAMDNVRLYCKELQKDQNATSISLDKTSLIFTAKNQTATLTATVLPSNATDKSVTWKSSNSAVATVDASGKVTAVSNGTATITATTNDGSNKSASCTVTVEINEDTEIEISNWSNDVIAENTPVASYTDESLDNNDWVLFTPEVKANDALQIVKGKLTTNSGTVYAINPARKNALVLRKANSPQTLNFTTPVRCGKIYFITISGEGASTLEAVVNYDDGSKESAKQYSVPDWYSTQSDQGEVIYGLSRINRASNEFADVNYFRIFEYVLPTNANKKVKSLTFTNKSSAIPTILGVTTADKTVEMHVVTYEVLYDGKLVATATRKVADGSVLPEPPSSLTNSYVALTKYGTHPTKVTQDVTVRFTATWNGPFEFSKSAGTAKWYNMTIRGSYYVGRQDGEPYYPTADAGDLLKTKAYHWAFGGDPYHVKVYNRTTDFTETLSKDGENAVMRSGDYTWDLLSNDGGFVLRETGTDYNCINQFGGADGPLKFWNDSKSLTDVGSIFRVEEAQALDETILANGITLSQTTLTFTEAGETVTLTATVSPNNATDRSVTWKSSNSAVATVDANGKVTAVANGTATITATTNDGSNKSASCTVTVEINEETEIEISNWRNDVIAENTPVASYTDESLDNYDWVLYSPDVRANGALQIADGKLTTNSGTVYAINPGKKNALVLRKANSPQTLNFTTPVKCGKIYFITISAEGASTLEAVVNYDDGSKESAKQYSVPDWYSTQSDQGEVIYGLGRINRASNEFADVNYFRIFEYLLPTNANKKVKSITFTNTSSAVPTILGVTTADKTVEMHVVTYEVLYDGKLVATATRKVADGSVLPEPPSSLTNSYVALTKYGTHPTKVTQDVTVRFTATWNGPFEFSKDDSSAKWYNMHIHNGWYVGKQNGEPYYPKQNDGKITQTAEYLWAFGGDPYHVKVYNYTTGFAETLTKDGENAVMRLGDYSWDILPNSDGFVLRETGTDYNCINQYGGAGGPLKFWYNGNSPTDNASTFRVEEAMDIVDGIESFTPALSKGEGEIYDLSGRKMGNGRRNGIYIIRMKDGTSRKVLIK